MSPPVFISYARTASREQAEALHRALGGPGGLAFLDTSEIEWGEKIPHELVDALLASRVVVLFASEEYFQRRTGSWLPTSDISRGIRWWNYGEPAKGSWS